MAGLFGANLQISVDNLCRYKMCGYTTGKPNYVFVVIVGCFPLCQTDRSEISGNTRGKWNDIFRLNRANQ